jgi:hypothetical protein
MTAFAYALSDHIILKLIFNRYHSQAPGEAEAELAQLSKLGKIDAVLTDDVDALVFGATKILRKSVVFPPTIPHPSLRLYDMVRPPTVYS